MGYGVIGNTAVSGTAILGSSPGTPANAMSACAKSVGSSGLGPQYSLGYAGSPENVLAPVV